MGTRVPHAAARMRGGLTGDVLELADSNGSSSDSSDDEGDGMAEAAMDESFRSALVRLQEKGKGAVSPSSRGKANGDFKRLLKSQRKCAPRINRNLRQSIDRRAKEVRPRPTCHERTCPQPRSQRTVHPALPPRPPLPMGSAPRKQRAGSNTIFPKNMCKKGCGRKWPSKKGGAAAGPAAQAPGGQGHVPRG